MGVEGEAIGKNEKERNSKGWDIPLRVHRYAGCICKMLQAYQRANSLQ